ncbi:MAG: HAD-IA family hydrolase [Betaproteobacteria bacterium]|nr:HAD-IA family hydrolase [Betaproteobacteria bacterium]
MRRRSLRYNLIVFDWDGTLIDSAGAIVECIQHAARELGLDVPDRERASHVIGLGLQDSLRHAVPSLPQERTMEFVASYRREFLAREDRMQLFPGVVEMLDALRDRGHALAVATGKSRRGLERALDGSGLRTYFATSRCADESEAKPHPAMLRELMRELNVEPARALMIGDTSHDLRMAAAAGVDALAVSHGAHAESDLRALQPRACLAGVPELRQWLLRHA